MMRRGVMQPHGPSLYMQAEYECSAFAFQDAIGKGIQNPKFFLSNFLFFLDRLHITIRTKKSNRTNDKKAGGYQ